MFFSIFLVFKICLDYFNASIQTITFKTAILQYFFFHWVAAGGLPQFIAELCGKQAPGN